MLYYAEVLGIKNIYFNSRGKFYIKNDIYTDKIHITLKSQEEINCTSQETFCGDFYNCFFHPKVIKPER